MRPTAAREGPVGLADVVAARHITVLAVVVAWILRATMSSSTVKQLARAKACSTVKHLARAKALMAPTEVDPEQGFSAPRSTECSIVRPAEQTFGTHEPPAKFPSTPQACWPFSL